LNGQLHAPVALPPDKDRSNRWLEGWAGPWTIKTRWRKQKSPFPAPARLEPHSSHYIDWITLAPTLL